MRDHVKSVRLRLGRKVQVLRRLRGLSQEQLAERANSSLKQVGRVERGEVNVTIDVLIRLAAGLRVNVSELFALDTDRPDFLFVPTADLERAAEAFRVIERLLAGRPRARRHRSR